MFYCLNGLYFHDTFRLIPGYITIYADIAKINIDLTMKCSNVFDRPLITFFRVIQEIWDRLDHQDHLDHRFVYLGRIATREIYLKNFSREASSKSEIHMKNAT